MKQTRRPLVLASLLTAMFMAALEMTVVSTAMPTVVGDLGGIDLYAWVFTAYLVTSTVMVPIFGKLADLFGRKPILLFGTSVFLLASLACGLANSMMALVVFRGLQGFGAGAMQPIVVTIIGDLYSLEERAKIQAFTSGLWGFAGLIGPLLGGFIVDVLSWHWIFLINVPVALLSIVGVSLFLHEEVEKQRHRLDFAGAALLCGGILLLLAGTSGSEWGLFPLLPAGLLLAVFVWVEKRAEEPIFPIDLMSSRLVVLASVCSALLGASMMATVTYLPLYVQAILGGSPTDAGRAVTPMVVGWPIASYVAGRLIPRLGFRYFIRAGAILAFLSALSVSLLFGREGSVLLLQIVMFCFGSGLGFTSIALLLALQTSVDWNQRGVATAGNMFFRTIGGTLAVGGLGGILAMLLSRVPNAPPGAADALLGPEHGASLSPELLRSLSGALESGLQLNFQVVAALGAIGLVAGLLFPDVRPRESPPIHTPRQA